MQMFDAINIRIAIHAVHRHYIFRMTVFYHSQIAKFAFYSVFRGKHVAHLYIYSAALFLGYKVDLSLIKHTYINSVA